jgi:hypothetical protein
LNPEKARPPAKPLPSPKVERLGQGAEASVSEAKVEAIGGPAPSEEALKLIKPATGAVAQKSAEPVKAPQDEALRALVAAGLFSIRSREYPTIGCDSYDCIPDDIDDPEAYADEIAAAEAAESQTAIAATTEKAEPEKPVEAKPESGSEAAAEGTAS